MTYRKGMISDGHLFFCADPAGVIFRLDSSQFSSSET